MSEYWVIVSHRGGASPSVVHSDRTCALLLAGHDRRPASAAEIDRLEECDKCRGEFGGSETGPDWSAYRAAESAEVSPHE